MLVAIKARWDRLRASQTAKLLVLEFLVVLAGVLAAQMLQGWLSDRAERNRAETQVRGIASALHNAAELAVIRQRMAVCMRDRIERVRDALASETIDQSRLEWVRVPEQNILDDPGIDIARELIVKVYGPDLLVRFNLIDFAWDYLYIGQNDELAAWQELALLHPANGPVDPALRARLKGALADAQRANRMMFEVSGMMRTQSTAMGTPIHENTIENFAGSPKLCASMAGYTLEEHAAAFEEGTLPDGTEIHPRVLMAEAPSAP